MELSISLAPEILFKAGSFPVTNTFLWSVVLSVILIAVIVKIGSSLKMIPGRFQNILELLIEEGFNFVENTIGSREKAQRVFPLVFTMFIFILFANLITFIPGQAAVMIHSKNGELAPFRAIMSDYGMVFVLTLISIITAQVAAIFVHGPFGYIGKFLNFKSPLAFILGIMDIIGELAKVLSLSFRLFGNMFAGEVLGSVMLFLMPFFIPLPFAFLGLITAVIQAFVFSLLTLIFISMSTEIAEKKEAQ